MRKKFILPSFVTNCFYIWPDTGKLDSDIWFRI